MHILCAFCAVNYGFHRAKISRYTASFEVDASGITARQGARSRVTRLLRGSFACLHHTRRALGEQECGELHRTFVAASSLIVVASCPQLSHAVPAELRFGVHWRCCAPRVPSRSLCGCVGTSVGEYVCGRSSHQGHARCCSWHELIDIFMASTNSGLCRANPVRLDNWLYLHGLTLSAGNNRAHYVAAAVFFA